MSTTNYRFFPMDESTAREILTWRYEPPYEMFNVDPANADYDVAVLMSARNPTFVVRDLDGNLIAYRCFGPEARVPGGDYSVDALDTGGGMRPDLTGQGRGLGLLLAGLEFGTSTFKLNAFRVTVAEFNMRAQKVCERAGFEIVSTFARPTDGMRFVIMTKAAPSM